MTIQEALEEAQTLADYTGIRCAIIDLSGELEVVKHQFCDDTGVKPLEIVRPSNMKPPYAFQNLVYRNFKR